MVYEAVSLVRKTGDDKAFRVTVLSRDVEALPKAKDVLAERYVSLANAVNPNIPIPMKKIQLERRT